MIIYLGNQLTNLSTSGSIIYLDCISSQGRLHIYIFRLYICPGEAQTGSQTAALARAPASPDDPTQTRSTGLPPRSPPRDRRPPPAMTSPLSLVSVVAG